jgi:hypothetical protein
MADPVDLQRRITEHGIQRLPLNRYSTMTRESSDWAKVEALFHEALEIDEYWRDDYLRQRCGDEASLYREVVGLLAADAETRDVIGEAMRGAAEMIDTEALVGFRRAEGARGRVALFLAGSPIPKRPRCSASPPPLSIGICGWRRPGSIGR